MTEPTNDKVSAALVAAQAEMPVIPFDSTNPFLKNRYASLGSVIATSRPILAKHKLAIIQTPISNNGDVSVHTIIYHESGQTIDGGLLTLSIGDEKGKSRAQVAGSIITYLKRYAWASLLGLYADEDDDGNEPQPRRPVTPPAAKERFETMRKATEEYIPGEAEVSASDWDKATPAKTVQNAPSASLGVQTPPTPEKTPISDPESKITDSKEKLWTVLEILKAREGEPNREGVTAFLRAAKVIGPEQEPENWPAKWLPYRKPSHLRDLGLAIANFQHMGGPVVMPYPPNVPVIASASTTPGVADPASKSWQAVSVPYGPIKGTALGQLPQDVQFDLWSSFEVSKVKDPQGKTMDLPVDRKFRDALDCMGVEKSFTKSP